MAKGDTVNIEFDENMATVPAFAMEATQKQLLAAAKALVSTDKKAQKKYDKLVKTTTDYHKNQKGNKKDTDDFRDKQLDLLAEISKANRGVELAKGLGLGALKYGLMGITGAVVVASGALVALTGAAKAGMDRFGQMQTEMTRNYGLGMDDVGGSFMDLVAESQRLGLTLKDLENLTATAGKTIQTVGKRNFGEFQRQLADATNQGSKFGMTMSELTSYMVDDLETRQSLGILQDLDATKQAQRSAALFDQQLKATTILGKSINDIRKSGKESISTNAKAQLSLMAMASQNEEGAADFLASYELMAGKLTALGIPDDLVNTFTTSMFDLNAFLDEGARNLSHTFSAIPGGEQLTQFMNDVQEARASGDLLGAEALMNEFPEKLAGVAAALNADELIELQATAEAFARQGNQEAASFLLTLPALRKGSERLSSSLEAMFPKLAKASATFQNASNTISGSIASLFTEAMSTLGGPLQGIADAFNDTTEKVGKETKTTLGLTSVFRQEFEAIMQAVGNIFGDTADGTEKDFSSLSTMIRETFIPAIRSTSQKIQEWLGDITMDDIQKQLDSVVKAFKDFGNWVRDFLVSMGVLNKVKVAGTREITQEERDSGKFPMMQTEVIDPNMTKYEVDENWAQNLVKGIATDLFVGVFKGALVVGAIAAAANVATGKLLDIAVTVFGKGAKGIWKLLGSAVGSSGGAATKMFAGVIEKFKGPVAGLVMHTELLKTSLGDMSKSVVSQSRNMLQFAKGFNVNAGSLSKLMRTGPLAMLAGAGAAGYGGGKFLDMVSGKIDEWMGGTGQTMSDRLADTLYEWDPLNLRTEYATPSAPSKAIGVKAMQQAAPETKFTTTSTSPTPNKPQEQVPELLKRVEEQDHGKKDEVQETNDAETHKLLTQITEQLRVIKLELR